MATIKRFEDIESWKMAKELCSIIGKHIDEGRFKRNYRLIDQLEGSSGSIMDNIAEGFERGTKGEFMLFLGYAKGSAGELRSQLYRALNRGYIKQDEFDTLFNLVIKISGLLQKFIEYLLKTNISGSRKNLKP
ncbi:MAG: four helix bundle protein [Chitinophagaceae bacterium]|nr:four helix bundle protein [Chitinophagaceae bacterium]